jgi:hypothetical protein
VTTELRATVRACAQEWATLLRGDPCEARPVLRRLLVERLTLTPRESPEGRRNEISGTATYGALLASAIVSVVPPG